MLALSFQFPFQQWFDESDMVGLTVELLDGTSNAAAQQQQTQAVTVQQH